MRIFSYSMVMLGILMMVSANVSAEMTLRQITALHWLPETANIARAYSIAEVASGPQEMSSVDAKGQETRRAQSSQSLMTARGLPTVSSHLASGHWGYWVLTRQGDASRSFFMPSLEDLPPDPFLEWPIWQAVVAREATAIWAGVGAAQREKIFGDLWRVFEQAPNAHQQHALSQARRIERMRAARAESTAQTILSSLLLAESQFQWRRAHYLESVWLLLEGMMHVASQEDAQNARFYANWLNDLPEDEVRQLRQIDINLPVIVALLVDSATHLINPSKERDLAVERMASAYSRLTLFVSNPSIYLDQPIRGETLSESGACLSATKPRVISECLADLNQSLANHFQSEELVGANGPYSSQFLLRELDLISWQRARYLDGYTQWRLGQACQVPRWFNLLEWSLATAWWQGLMDADGVDLDGDQYQSNVNSEWLPRVAQFKQEAHQWLECMSGGSPKSNVIAKFVELQRGLLDALSVELETAMANFYREAVRPQSDIDLDQPLILEQGMTPTSYRNTELKITPCDPVRACGSRVELTPSSVLLDLVPAGFWIADQMRLGEVSFCYDNVRWTDRQMSIARANDSGVADYSGRLSFNLLAEFTHTNGDIEPIFNRHLETKERANFFFGRADEAQLEMDCPYGLDGQPVQSTLENERAGLVPERLTYFTSIPTPTSAYLSANWETWQLALLDDEQVTIHHATGDRAIYLEAERHRRALIDRRERTLATQMSSLETQASNRQLVAAMLEVDAISRLMRRILELHYGWVLNRDDLLRSLVAGEESLLSRDDIRMARDQGIQIESLIARGHQRLDQFEQQWERYPDSLTQSGQVPAELMMSEIMLRTFSDEQSTAP